jgi:hypothetical protein
MHSTFMGHRENKTMRGLNNQLEIRMINICTNQRPECMDLDLADGKKSDAVERNSPIRAQSNQI